MDNSMVSETTCCKKKRNKVTRAVCARLSIDGGGTSTLIYQRNIHSQCLDLGIPIHLGVLFLYF
jgi:hypothetical protein